MFLNISKIYLNELFSTNHPSLEHIYGINETALLDCTLPIGPGIIALEVIILTAAFLNTIRTGLSFEYKISPKKNIKYHIVGQVSQFVLIPGLFVLCIWLFKDIISPYQKMSIIVLSACPGGIASTGFSENLGGNKEKASRLSTLGLLTSIVITPVLMMVIG